MILFWLFLAAAIVCGASCASSVAIGANFPHNWWRKNWFKIGYICGWMTAFFLMMAVTAV